MKLTIEVSDDGAMLVPVRAANGKEFTVEVLDAQFTVDSGVLLMNCTIPVAGGLSPAEPSRARTMDR